MGVALPRLVLAAAVCAAAVSIGPSAAHGRTPFDDVPPCHWSAPAVARLAGTGIVVGFPGNERYASVNAVRQVFEGMRCADAGWSLRFIAGAPVQFGLLPRVALVAFELEPTLTEHDGEQAVVQVALRVVLDQGGERQTLERSGAVAVERTLDGWRVPYAQLAALDLPVFPTGPVAN